MTAFELFAVLKLNTDDFKKKLPEAEGSATKFSDSLKSVIGGAIKGLGVAVGAAFAGISKGFISLTKEAVASYADYEQLVGGVEKLFGDNAQAVIENASQAYKTAGLDANAYMETVTSFSASLISSLGNDTQAAASYADQAIRDMSDNANTFGTDIGMLQSAYQGFAKQNYTMLDNLKLGYGGTKTEMERLIADANKVKQAHGEMANLSIDSFADVTEAIHIMQEEMGVAGTTQKEAAKTIEGSINATKAAWKNFVTGLGDSNADIKKLAKDVIDSATNVVKNVTPIIKNVVEAIPEALSAIAQAIEENDLISTVIQAAKDIILGLTKALPELLRQVIDTVVEVLPQVIEGIVEVLPAIVEAVANLFVQLMDHLDEILQPIFDALPEIITAVLSHIDDFIIAFLEALPKIIDGLLSALPEIIEAIIGAIPDIIFAIIEYLPQAVVQIAEAIIENFPAILAAIVKGLGMILIKIVEWFGELFGVVDEEGDGLIDDIAMKLWELEKKFADWVMGILRKIGDFFKNIWEAVTGFFKNIWDHVSGWFSDMWGKISGFFSDIWSSVSGWVSGVWTNMTGALSNLWSNITGWLSNLWGNITGKISEAWEWGKNLVTGLWNGISSSVSWLWNKISGWLSGLWDSILGFFGIHSPSKEFAWMGDMMIAGLGNAFDQNGDQAVKKALAMAEDINDAMGTLQTDYSITAHGDTEGLNYEQTMNAKIDNLIALLTEYLPELNSQQIVLDSGVLVGETIQQIDKGLGNLQLMTARGV